MKRSSTVSLLVLSINSASSFAPYGCQRRRSSSLFGKIRFNGSAVSRLDTTSIIANIEDEDKSLSNFLTSPASDTVLLGTPNIAKLNDDEENGVLWECRQGNIDWFGLQLVPIFINRIQKDPSSRNVVISITDATTEVEKGGKIGNTLASVMKKSKFDGRTSITWAEQNNGATVMEGNLKLTLSIDLPSFLPLPPGFNAIGSKIIESTCKERLTQNLSGISDAYVIWATPEVVAADTTELKNEESVKEASVQEESKEEARSRTNDLEEEKEAAPDELPKGRKRDRIKKILRREVGSGSC